jgi:Rrf2 family protein
MMRMSTKGHHATRMLIFLANSPARPISKAEIGEAEAISSGYVQQLMTALTDAGLVRSHRGKAGGFTLARAAQDITVREVLQVTEGPFELAPCVDLRQECPRSDQCAAHLLWQEAAGMVNELFDRTTIGDLALTARRLQPVGDVRQPAV